MSCNCKESIVFSGAVRGLLILVSEARRPSIDKVAQQAKPTLIGFSLDVLSCSGVTLVLRRNNPRLIRVEGKKGDRL